MKDIFKGISLKLKIPAGLIGSKTLIKSQISTEYEERMAQEKKEYLEKYAEFTEDEPLFERTSDSWGYIEQATQKLIREKVGFSQWEYVINQASQIEKPEMLSLGSGPCGVEISIAEKITSNYHYHCLDLNEELLGIGKKQIEKKGLNISTEPMDLNLISLEEKKYDIITAFASLHHLNELERVYTMVNRALKPDGIFVTVDVITKNGLMMWPETYDVLVRLWSIWPDKFKINHTYYGTPRFTPEYGNIDYSQGSFEGIRSQDILPLIPEYFDPIIYVPCHSICRQLLDTQYGPNYNLDDPFDKSMVEFIWNLDCYYIHERVLPPGTMFAVMRKKGTANPKIVAEVAGHMNADSRARQVRWIGHTRS